MKSLTISFAINQIRILLSQITFLYKFRALLSYKRLPLFLIDFKLGSIIQLQPYGMRIFGFWFLTKLMLGTGRSSQTKTRLLLQGSSCHLRPSLYLLSRRAIHASLPHPFGLRVPSGCLRPVGPVVLQLLYCDKMKKGVSYLF